MQKKSTRKKQIVTEQKEAARILGITDRALRDWMRVPGFPDWSAGYDIEGIKRWRDEQERKGSEKSEHQKKIKEKIDAQTLRRATALADKAEREEAEAKGNILPRDEWELFAREHVNVTRDRLMAIPKILCRIVPRQYHSRIKTEGEKEVRKILEELGRQLQQGNGS